MYPTFFESAAVSLHTWGLMVTLAFTAAAGVAHWRAPKVGIDPDKLVSMYVVLAVTGLVGARLLHFLFAEREAFLADPLIFFSCAGGWAFYGGAIGGGLGAVLVARARKLPVWKLADVFAPSLMLGYAIGRMGCFAAGCCHGGVLDQPVLDTVLSLPAGEILRVEGAPWLALQFTPGVGVGALRGQPLFPSQLLEMGVGIVLFGLLSWMWRSGRRFDGQVVAALLVAYAGMRSFTEQFRGDAIRGLYDLGPVSLSTSQIVSVAMVVLAAGLVAWRLPKGLAPEAPFEPPEPVV